MILWEIMTRKRLFSEFGPSDGVILKEHVVQGGRPPIESKCVLKRLVEQCWSAKPEQRPSFDDVSCNAAHNSRTKLLSIRLYLNYQVR